MPDLLWYDFVVMLGAIPAAVWALLTVVVTLTAGGINAKRVDLNNARENENNLKEIQDDIEATIWSRAKETMGDMSLEIADLRGELDTEKERRRVQVAERDRRIGTLEVIVKELQTDLKKERAENGRLRKENRLLKENGDII